MRSPPYDVVALGEVMLRLAARAPLRLEHAGELDVSFGGAEANVLCALARLGRRTAWVSALPRNVWGERLGRELRGHGVDVSHVVWREGSRLPARLSDPERGLAASADAGVGWAFLA